MKIIRDFFRLAAGVAAPRIDRNPEGMIEDDIALYGLVGSARNLNQALGVGLTTVDSDSQTVTATAAGVVGGILNRTGSPGGAVTETTPTAAQIISALPRSARQANQHQWIMKYVNNALGQTVTWTAGTGVTVTGTATIATDTVREFLVSVDSSSAVTFLNLGSKSL